jgi:hypothetical protein
MAKVMDWASGNVVLVAFGACVVGQVVMALVLALLAGDLVVVGNCVATRTLLDVADCAAAFARVTGR